jgi:hypothetical protein
MTAKTPTKRKGSKKLSKALSFLELDPHAHLQAIGFYDQVDRAFAELTAEIAAKADEVRAYMEKRFAELESSL